jgi:hypothetical protein
MALTFRIVCPHCSEPTRAPAEEFYRWWPNDEEGDDHKVVAAVASYCPECEGLIGLLVQGPDKVIRPILTGDTESTDWEFSQEQLTLKEMIPARPGRDLGKSVPKEIRAVWPDLVEDVTRRRNPAGTITTCRGILETALRALDQTHHLDGLGPHENLVKRIDRLRNAGLITASVAEWAHEIRLDGNQSAHELVGDPKRAADYCRFLKVFLEVAFDLPDKIAAIKAGKLKTMSRKPKGQAAA